MILKKALALPRLYTRSIATVMALSIGILIAQSVIPYSLEQTMDRYATTLLTADIEVAANRPITDEIKTKIHAAIPTHNASERRIFSTMIQYYGSDTQLVDMVAISDTYPLKGDCLVQTKTAIVPIQNILNSTENVVVISEALRQQTDIMIGSHIQVGNFKARVIGVVVEEPDMVTQSLSFSPRVYMPLSKIEDTGFDPNLTRAYHSYFLTTTLEDAGPLLEKALDINANKKTIRGSYGPTQPLIVRTSGDVAESVRPMMTAIQDFLRLLAILTLIFSSLCFASILWASLIKKESIIDKCQYLGVPASEIAHIYTNLGIKLGGFVTVFGIGISSLLVYTGMTWVGKKIPMLQLVIPWAHLLIIIILPTFILVSITRTIIILRHDHRIPWTLISLCLGGFVLCLWVLKGPLLIMGVLILIIAILWSLDALLFSRFNGGKSIETRLGFMYLRRSSTLRRIAFISLSFSFIVLGLVANYQSSLSAQFSNAKASPRLFVTDLYPYQVATFKENVSYPYQLAPLIRTRIQRINNIPVQEYESQVSDAYYLYREQNLSSRATLDDDILKEGQWFNANDDIIETSVESRFAKRLGLKISDQIEFEILGYPFVVTVTSIRDVNWGSFKPNFFMVIEPPYLKDMPQSMVGAIYTDTPEETKQLKQRLTPLFPNIRLIDIQSTSEKILSIVNTLFACMHIASILCMGLGALIAGIAYTLCFYQRLESMRLLKWLGLSQRSIKRIQKIDSMGFLICTCLASIILTLVLSQIVIQIILKRPLFIHWLWLSASLVVVSLGVLGINYRMNQHETV